MKPWQTLPGLLKRVLVIEIGAFVLNLAADPQSLAESELLWFLLVALWLVGWIALWKNWSSAFEIYAIGWIVGLIYFPPDGPFTYSRWEDFLGTVTAMAGGAALLLAWLRKSRIGDWSQPHEELPA